MPETERPTSTPDRPRAGDASSLGAASDVLATAGPHAFTLPVSHSVRLAQAAAATTGVLALLVLGLRFVDLREPQGDLAPPAPVAIDRTEVDLPSLTKPVRSDIPSFRGDDRPEGEAAAPEPVEAASTVAALPPPPAPPAREAAEAAHPPTPAAHLPDHAAEMPFAGVWGPDDSACTPRTNRAGYLPAVITAQGAFAGETSCAFRNAKPTANGWSVSATCQSPKGRWTTQVRLTVTGRRLIWSSARGTQTYVRCGETSPRARG
jgi:hypothetical protein